MLPNKILRTNSGCLDTSTHQSRSGRPDTPRVNEREKENTKQLPQRKAPDHRRFQWIPKRKERYGWRPASNLYVSDQTEFQTLIIKQRRAVHQLWSETRMTPKGYWEKATEIKGKRGNLLVFQRETRFKTNKPSDSLWQHSSHTEKSFTCEKPSSPFCSWSHYTSTLSFNNTQEQPPSTSSWSPLSALSSSEYQQSTCR